MIKKYVSLLIFSIFSLFLLAACNETDKASGSNEERNENESASEAGNSENTIQAIKDQKLSAENPELAPQASTNRGDTVVVTLQEPGGIFTPYFNSSGYDGNVQSVMFPPLVDVNEKGEPIPGLAESWEISDDELTFTFYLRDHLKFDDGSPLTTEDVAFTLTLLHDPSYAGGTDITEAAIVGGLDYKEGDATEISGIKIIDEKTIQITTEKVNARSLRLLGSQVLKKDYYGNGYKKGNLDYIRDLHLAPIGAGPFRYVKYFPGQEIRYEANEHYYGGKPEISTFIYKTTKGDSQQFFQTGEVDYTTLTANADSLELLKSLGFANIDLYTSTAYSYIAFNHKNPIFAQPEVRQALNYGLDRETILNVHYQGLAQTANVPVAPVSWAYTDEIAGFPYDPEKAKKLLEAAGWVEGKDGVREKDGEKLTIYYYATSGGVADTLIPIAKENYREIGVDFQVELMDFNALLARVEKGDHDLASFSTPMQTDPYNGVQSFHSKDTSSIVSGYKNEKVDKLIEATIATNDIEERKKAFHELYLELEKDPPLILFGYSKVLAGTNARVEGFNPNGFRGISPSLPNLKIVDVKQ